MKKNIYVIRVNDEYVAYRNYKEKEYNFTDDFSEAQIFTKKDIVEQASRVVSEKFSPEDIEILFYPVFEERLKEKKNVDICQKLIDKMNNEIERIEKEKDEKEKQIRDRLQRAELRASAQKTG